MGFFSKIFNKKVSKYTNKILFKNQQKNVAQRKKNSQIQQLTAKSNKVDRALTT